MSHLVAEFTEHKPTLEEAQKLIGGYVELIQCKHFQLLVDEEIVWLEKMTPNNVSLINSDPSTYKYKDNDGYLPPIDLRKKPDVLAGI